jgi:hypothetical protein
MIKFRIQIMPKFNWQLLGMAMGWMEQTPTRDEIELVGNRTRTHMV